MSNPKEKAIELYEKFYYKIPTLLDEKILDCLAQECALLAVDEILNLCWNGNLKAKEYWEEVKKEILNL
jgi:hypothetical protein